MAREYISTKRKKLREGIARLRALDPEERITVRSILPLLVYIDDQETAVEAARDIFRYGICGAGMDTLKEAVDAVDR